MQETGFRANCLRSCAESITFASLCFVGRFDGLSECRQQPKT
ncbi:hypothetical protein EVA_09134 [gut metagenome]|uniref:Uncharacterized protein n=1 Tax=gut metagenome TaxID=749906 RepID=J9G7A8_9ZZZZ